MRYQVDGVHFGDDYNCCMSCAWNEFRLTKYQKAREPLEVRTSGRRDFCVLRQTPLPESHLQTALCNEYQPALAGLPEPSPEFLRSLPDDELWPTEQLAGDPPWALAKLPPPVEQEAD